MSLLKKAFSGIKSLVKSPLVQGAIGTAFPAARPLIAAASAVSAIRRPTMIPPGGSPQPAISMASIQPMSILPQLPALAGAAARTVSRGVARYGGAAGAVVGVGALLYDAAGNPVARRRRPRSKGITARELKSFTRVTALLNKYCKTPAPMKRRTNTRSKSCR